MLSEATVLDVTLKQLYWPLSVIRMESPNRASLTEAAMKLYHYWEHYTNEEAGIYAKTDAPHNAITPIVRKQNDLYILDMTLRNNRTSKEYPLGVFHPHAQHHHIKKENIGLIEVMGLAVLPARLSKELPLIKLSMHNEWVTTLKETYHDEDIDTFINNEVARKFMMVIEDAGVFKQTSEGQKHFDEFFKGVLGVLRK